MIEYIYISSIENKNKKYNYSMIFFLAPRGCLKVDPLQSIFNEQLVVYQSYSLLTTHHREIKCVLHSPQQIFMAFFFINNSLSLGCSSKEQFALNNEDLDLFMNPSMFP